MHDAAQDQPTLHFTQAPGIRLAHFEWHADRRGQGPTVWLVHATGFHGRVWDQAVRRLPAERHVIAIEQRCHGRSEPVPFDNWRRFGEDQAAQIDACGIQGATHGVIGVGHSMGAHALVQAASLRPGAFSRLILVDPVMTEPAAYQQPPVPLGQLHPSAQRKNHFDSPQAMFDRFADRPPYVVFERAALMDYCVHGLRPADNGQGFQLCCAPQHEGQVYPLARNFPSTYDLVRALDIPVLVVRARPQDPSIKPWDPTGSPTWPGLAAQFPQGRDLPFADKTHFLPMEDPALMARLIEAEIAALNTH